MKLGQAPAATILVQQDVISIRAPVRGEEIDSFYGPDKSLLLVGNILDFSNLRGGNLSK
jgi:hypothetical protein